MSPIGVGTRLSEKVFEFVRRGFHPHFWELDEQFPSNERWKKLSSLGTELWLDSGDMEGIEPIWTREFCALTTNNTLLNKEVQKGIYDEFIVEADRLLSEFRGLSEAERRLELSFMLNAHHGLRLVETYDAYVSVEEHTDLANDVEGAVAYAKRLHEVCPERFIVKIPFTPAGLLATRILSAEGIPINHTLGFSARQNYVIARIGRPEYVNVFLGRLNSFVKENGLGSGDLVGEKATLASQGAIREIRKTYDLPCRQIGASLRSGEQIRNLAGIDVMTIPLKAAKEFVEMNLPLSAIESRIHREYEVGVREDVSAAEVGLDTLWEIDEWAVACVEALEQENPEKFSPDDLLNFFELNGCRDLLVRWTESERRVSREEGKIPVLGHWREALAEGRIGLDALMNLAGLNSFATDQADMDRHVGTVLEEAGVVGLA
jgi:transaldolase